MVLISKENINLVKAGSFILYKEEDRLERVYEITSILYYYSRSFFYSKDGTFGCDSMSLDNLIECSYYLLNEKEVNYYKKLAIFK